MTAIYVRDAAECGPLAEWIRQREEAGLDKLDEVWERVLRISPPPHGFHQKVILWLGEIARVQARRHGLGEAYGQVGVREPGSGRSNYRVPDLARPSTGTPRSRGRLDRGRRFPGRRGTVAPRGGVRQAPLLRGAGRERVPLHRLPDVAVRTPPPGRKGIRCRLPRPRRASSKCAPSPSNCAGPSTKGRRRSSSRTPDAAARSHRSDRVAAACPAPPIR